MSQSELLIEAVEALESAGAGYLLSGSLASSMQGEPRATHDIDLVVEVDLAIVDALAAAFGADEYYFDHLAARQALVDGAMFNLINTKTGDKVDFWALTESAFDRSRFNRRVRVSAFGIQIAVSAPEDTILQKLSGPRRLAARSGRYATPLACTSFTLASSMRTTSLHGRTNWTWTTCFLRCAQVRPTDRVSELHRAPMHCAILTDSPVSGIHCAMRCMHRSRATRAS